MSPGWSGPIVPPIQPRTQTLSLNTSDLLQLGDDLDEIVLSAHDFLDVLVGTGNFVDDAPVLSALDTHGLRFQIIEKGGAGMLIAKELTKRMFLSRMP